MAAGPSRAVAAASHSPFMAASMMRPLSRRSLGPSTFSPSITSSRQFSSSPAYAFASSSPSRAIFSSSNTGSQSTTDDLKDTAASSSNQLQEAADLAASAASSTSAQAGNAVSSAVDSAKETASSAADAASNLVDAVTPEVVRSFSDVTLSSWPNVRITEYGLDWLVETTGAPWWAIIIGVTLSVRVLLFPFAAKGQAQSMRLAHFNPQLQEHMADVQDASRRRDNIALQESQMKAQKFMKDNDLRPFAAFKLPAVQMPIFASFFFALRALAEQNLDTMKAGGLFWFPDLTMADPTGWTLPIMSSVFTLAVMETGAEMGAAATAKDGPQKYTRWIMRGVFVVLPFFVKSLPAAVFVYWMTSAASSLLQLALLQIPALRRYYDLPDKKKMAAAVPTTSSTRDRRRMTFAEAVSAGYQSQQPVNGQQEQYLASPGLKAGTPLSKQENAYEKWFKPEGPAGGKAGKGGSLFEEDNASSDNRGSSPDNEMSLASMRRELRRKQDEAEAKKQRALASRERRNNRRRY